MTDDEKRSPTCGIARMHGLGHGVGGRQSNALASTAGGGYPGNCTSSRLAILAPRRDPRLDELAEIGLGQLWLDLAATLGFDAFMAAWQELDRSGPAGAARENHRIRVPVFERWVRHQRNSYIASLDAEGLSSTEIAAAVRREMGEDVSPSMVRKVIADRRSP